MYKNQNWFGILAQIDTDLVAVGFGPGQCTCIFPPPLISKEVLYFSILSYN